MTSLDQSILAAMQAIDEFDWESINEMRLYSGLPPLRPGTAKCLKCDGDFASWDVTMNRICPECRYENTADDTNNEANYHDEAIYLDDVNEHNIERGLGINRDGRIRPKRTDQYRNR